MTANTQVASRRVEGVLLLVTGLVSIYSVSQFLRNSIGVIANDLARELSLTATEIGLLSSAFFLSFAAAQIPVGIAIDRFGPRATMLTTAALAICGTVLFSVAQGAPGLILARILMGLGCSTFFMAPLAIYARRFPPERFAGLTSIQMGVSNFGTLVATAPLAASTAAFGWRHSFLAIAAVTALLTVVVALVVPRDERRREARESWAEALRGVGRAIRTPNFGPVFFAHLTGYSTFATIIGLWAGPWLSDVYGVELSSRGQILLIGALAQMIGLLLWGVGDRFIASYKKPVLAGGYATVALLGIAALVPFGLPAAAAWLGAFGLAVAFTPILTAHGKALFPPELTGRGITLMNIGAIGGTFLSQTATGLLIDAVGRSPGGRVSPFGYQLVFAMLGGWLLLSLLAYRRVIDPYPGRHAQGA